jgi:RNA ligase
MYIPQETLHAYIAEGLLTEQRHPDADHLCIYNYTPACQYSRAWDDVTQQCRGLILDITQETCVARPFPKFFNYEEHLTAWLPMPDDLPIVTEKYDGSLGILYWLKDEPWIATRGSFTSPQAQWATRWLRSTMALLSRDGWDILRDPTVTHLFEIVAPVSRVVVSYDFEGLVHLATLTRATGRDIWPLPLLPSMRYPTVLPLGASLADVQARDSHNQEGYVALFPTTGLRLKAKFATYVRLHRLMTGLSEKALWELLSTGANLDAYLVNVPEEFVQWFETTKNKLLDAYQGIWTLADGDFQRLQLWMRAQGYAKATDRKAIAGEILQHVYPHLLFGLLDGKTIAGQIWKLVKPHGHHVFREDEA